MVVQLLPLFGTHPEEDTTVAVAGLGPLRIRKANVNDGLAGNPPGTIAEALSCGVWVFTAVPGSGSCSLICGANCWMVYGAQNWAAPSDAKVAPAALTTFQQISYEPGFSAGVTPSTVVIPLGATVSLMPTAGPVVSGVPVPLVSPEGNTRAARP